MLTLRGHAVTLLWRVGATACVRYAELHPVWGWTVCCHYSDLEHS